MVTVIQNVLKALSLKMVNVVLVNQNVNHVTMLKNVPYVKIQLKVYLKGPALMNVQKATVKTTLLHNVCSSIVINHALNVGSMKTSAGHVLMENTS